MQKKSKNYLHEKSKKMIVLSIVIFGGLLLWILANANTPPKQEHVPVASAVHVAHVAFADTTRFDQDSTALVERFKRIEQVVKLRTATIERLRSDSAELKHEADSLFVEVVMAGN